MIGNLVGLTGVLKEQGELVKAIRLCGTIQKLEEAEAGNQLAFYHFEYKRTINSLRSAYQLKDFERAWQEGYNFKGDMEAIQKFYFQD